MTSVFVCRGYCQTVEQYALLRAFGLEPKQIFREGVGAETIDACLSSFRGRRGVLYVAGYGGRDRQFGRIRLVGVPMDELILALMKARNLCRVCAAIT